MARTSRAMTEGQRPLPSSAIAALALPVGYLCVIRVYIDRFNPSAAPPIRPHRPHHPTAIDPPARQCCRPPPTAPRVPMPVPMLTTRTIQPAPGLAFGASIAGPADCPLVLMLHGFGVSRFLWSD